MKSAAGNFGLTSDHFAEAKGEKVFAVRELAVYYVAAKNRGAALKRYLGMGSAVRDQHYAVCTDREVVEVQS